MSEVAVINGMQYIGCTAPNESIQHHAATMDAIQTVENAVLAGPVTFTKIIIVTGKMIVL